MADSRDRELRTGRLRYFRENPAPAAFCRAACTVSAIGDDATQDFELGTVIWAAAGNDAARTL